MLPIVACYSTDVLGLSAVTTMVNRAERDQSRYSTVPLTYMRALLLTGQGVLKLLQPDSAGHLFVVRNYGTIRVLQSRSGVTVCLCKSVCAEKGAVTVMMRQSKLLTIALEHDKVTLDASIHRVLYTGATVDQHVPDVPFLLEAGPAVAANGGTHIMLEPTLVHSLAEVRLLGLETNSSVALCDAGSGLGISCAIMYTYTPTLVAVTAQYGCCGGQHTQEVTLLVQARPIGIIGVTIGYNDRDGELLQYVTVNQEGGVYANVLRLTAVEQVPGNDCKLVEPWKIMVVCGIVVHDFMVNASLQFSNQHTYNGSFQVTVSRSTPVAGISWDMEEHTLYNAIR